MPEHIRALFFILFAGVFSYYLISLKRLSFISLNEIRVWRKQWLLITCVGFLSFNYWLCVLILFMLFYKISLSKDNTHKICLYFLLLTALPELNKEIPGILGLRFLFDLTYPRIISLSLLLPLALKASKRKFFSLPSDKYLFIFLFFTALLSFRDTSFTNGLRQTFYLIIDFFLPYYILSRYINSIEDLKKISFAIIVSAVFMSLIAILESIKAWHFYFSLHKPFDISIALNTYIKRENLLRATGPFTSSIVLGYVFMIAIGFALSILKELKKNQLLIFSILVTGMFATLSRGPWVGLIFIMMIFIFTGKQKITTIAKLMPLCFIGAIIISFTPLGEKLFSLIPFIGDSSKDAASTFDYRKELFEKSMTVIQRNPWFGSTTYLETPEMESMRQGQGIIDVVNSYLRIALETGYVGLSLFLLFFTSLCFKLYFKIKQISKNDNLELLQYGRALLATMLAILLVIFTVSSIEVIPIFYYSIAGMIAAYLEITKQKHHTKHS